MCDAVCRKQSVYCVWKKAAHVMRAMYISAFVVVGRVGGPETAGACYTLAGVRLICREEEEEGGDEGRVEGYCTKMAWYSAPAFMTFCAQQELSVCRACRRRRQRRKEHSSRQMTLPRRFRKEHNSCILRYIAVCCVAGLVFIWVAHGGIATQGATQVG